MLGVVVVDLAYAFRTRLMVADDNQAAFYFVPTSVQLLNGQK
jgi:hypothetical protein